MTEREEIELLRNHVAALTARIERLEPAATRRAWFGTDAMTEEERTQHDHNRALALFGVPMP